MTRFASLLTAVDWLLVFSTVPIASALVIFRLTWAPALMRVSQELGGGVRPVLSQWVLEGALTPLWGLAALAFVGGGCALVRAPLGLRRGLLVTALVWSCLGAGVTWYAVYLPVFGVEQVGF